MSGRCSRSRSWGHGVRSWTGLLAANAARSSRERLTLIRIFEELRGLGYAGGYDAVRRYAASWRREQSAATAAAFVPLSFAPGEAYQFDWSHEIVLIAGVTVTVKVAPDPSPPPRPLRRIRPSSSRREGVKIGRRSGVRFAGRLTCDASQSRFERLMHSGKAAGGAHVSEASCGYPGSRR